MDWENKILKLTDIIKVEILKVAFKLNNDLMPINNRIFFNTNKNAHPYNTRNRNYAKAIKHKTSQFNNSIFNKAVTEWSKLPITMKKLITVQGFKSNVKLNIIKDY
jgi:uncharacterized membrane protein